jgi:hypothetical protein
MAMMHVIDVVLDFSPISFDPTGTLLSRRFYSVALFITGLSLKLKCLEESATAIAAMHSIIIRAGGEEVILT